MSRINVFAPLRIARFTAVLGFFALALFFAASAAKAAGCSPLIKGVAAASAPFVSPHPDDREDSGPFPDASIVGLWHLNYTAETETGAPIFPPVPFPFLESFKTWHADGTEFENAFVPPGGGNICFGVWKDLGNGTVKLHHIGLMFDATGAVSNIFTVDEKDTVSRNGQTYSGFFDFKLWPPTFSAVGVGTPIAEVTGKTAATRISVE